MQRCITLAAKAAGYVAPNPMVGAVLVHQDRIIGEGWHQVYGQSHAEVNCIRDAERMNQNLVSESTLYVSLEPCAHFGKTPPCADLIIAKKIKNVVIGCRDPFAQVDGKGIEKLQAANVHTTTGVLEHECISLNKRFFTFHTRHRPYIILKWAASADNKMARAAAERTFISNPLSNRLVHKWRAEEAAILVGTNTALLDDPSLTTRLWSGKNPIRLVADMQLRLPSSLKIFDGAAKTIVFNGIKNEARGDVQFVRMDNDSSLPLQMMQSLYKLNVQSVIIEGGRQVLQSFIDEGLWDEARVIRNNDLVIGKGLHAPDLPGVILTEQVHLQSDTIATYTSSLTKSS